MGFPAGASPGSSSVIRLPALPPGAERRWRQSVPPDFSRRRPSFPCMGKRSGVGGGGRGNQAWRWRGPARTGHWRVRSTRLGESGQWRAWPRGAREGVSASGEGLPAVIHHCALPWAAPRRRVAAEEERWLSLQGVPHSWRALGRAARHGLPFAWGSRE